MMHRPPPITAEERRRRIAALCDGMEKSGTAGVLIGPTASLRYFTGLSWHPSERFTGALIHADGRLEYICPRFEQDKVEAARGLPGDILTWQEEESPYALIAGRMGNRGSLAVDDQVALFTYRGLAGAMDVSRLSDARSLINSLRRVKSPSRLLKK